MKELEVFVPQDGPYGLEPEEGGEPVEEETCYLKSDVDAVIAGLEQKLEDNVAFWKKKLDDEMSSRRDEYEEAEKEIRRLKRALYKACANWAKAMDFYEDNPNELWSKMKYKCRAKAEASK